MTSSICKQQQLGQPAYAFDQGLGYSVLKPLLAEESTCKKDKGCHLTEQMCMLVWAFFLNTLEGEWMCLKDVAAFFHR